MLIKIQSAPFTYGLRRTYLRV